MWSGKRPVAECRHADLRSIAVSAVKRWADADVAAWLHSNRLGVHAACFARNDINGSVLLDVDQAALKEMGISSVGDRIRIFAAVKALKKRCTESAAARRASMRLGAASEAAAAVAAAHANAAHADGEMEYLEHDQPPANAARGFVPPGFAHVNGTPLSPSTGRRAAHTRPPPLHLTQSAAYGMPTTPTQSSPAPTASIPAPTGRSGLVPATARSVHPISPAPARSPLPPTKTSQPAQSGRAFPPSWDDSPTGQHRKVNSIGTATVYGSGTAQPAQQQTPTGQRPINPPVTGIRPLYQNPTRPSTATSAGTYGSNYGYGSACDHAQSGSASSSPTSAAFSVNAGRPSTAGGIGSGGGLGGIGGLVHPPLTPITESASYVRTPTTPGAAGLGSANVLNSASSAGGYSVGRGAFGGRPITPGSGFSAGSSSIASPAIAGSSVLSSSVTRGRPDTADGHGLAPPSLEDLKRRTIKFIGEDGNSRIVNVSDCRDAYDVLARVLKKFGKPASGNSYTPTAGQRDEGETENGESWGIFATSSDGQSECEVCIYAGLVRRVEC